MESAKSNGASRVEQIDRRPIRTRHQIEENPVGLPEEYCQKMCERLDETVSSFFTLFHQYQKHHWLVEGPEYMQLHELFQGHYEQVHEDMDEIAERMTTLGGIPTGMPSNQEQESAIPIETEGHFRSRSMVSRDCESERELALLLREVIALAERNDDFATGTILKHAIVRCEKRAHHLYHFLARDSLTDTGRPLD